MPEELWTEVHDIVREAVIETIPKKKKSKKAKWLSEEALQIAEKRREVKGKGEKERYTHLNTEFQRIARRDKQAFLSDQCKEIEAREFQKNIYFCLIDYTKAFDCVDHNKLWKILKEMGVPVHLTCLLRNLYAGQEATDRTGHGTTDWF